MQQSLKMIATVLALASCANGSTPPPQPAPPPTPMVIAAPAETPSSSPVVSIPPPPDAAPPPSASKETVFEIQDPVTDAKKSVSAKVGDTIAVILPEYPGMTWKVTSVDKTLGHPKEEMLPGYLGPGTPGRKFVWATGLPTPLDLKGSHVVTFTGIPLAGDAGKKQKVVLTIHLD